MEFEVNINHRLKYNKYHIITKEIIIFFQNIKGAISQSNTPILMSGQAYTVVVGINMPESPRNRDLGMFMSCLQIHSVNRKPPKKDEIIRVASSSSFTSFSIIKFPKIFKQHWKCFCTHYILSI